MMHTIDFLMRRYRRSRIDSPEELGCLIVCLAVVFAAQYFIKKFYPDISETLLKAISYGIIFVIVIIWVFVIPQGSGNS